MTYVPPILITIPIPLEDSKKRRLGPFSTTSGANFRLRCSQDEYNLIHDEAKQLGITGSLFARCIIVSVAQVMKKHRESHSTNDEAS